MVSDRELIPIAAEWGRIQAQEILLVAAGLKSSCRLRVSREKLPKLATLTKNLSLQLIIGYDAIASQLVPGRGGFSEWCKREPATPHTSIDCYAYLSASHIQGERLRRFDEAQDDHAVGELLGYPSCCIEAFCNRIRSDSRKGDPVLSAYVNSHPISWYLNVSLLCFDHGLLTHVPCNSDCQRSLDLAHSYFEFLFEQSSEYAIVITRMLATFVIHTQTWGIAAFTATRREDDLEVGDVMAVYADSVIGKLIRRRGNVKQEHDSVVIDGLILSENQARLYQYC